jgi:hypothetical protein
MASVVISGDTSGTATIQAQAVAGNTILTLPTTSGTLITDGVGQTFTNATLANPNISGAVVSTMASSVITARTAQATSSGTSKSFTSIPSWVKRITVIGSAVATNGNNHVLVQLGSGSLQTTGYNTAWSYTQSTAGGTAGFGVWHQGTQDILYFNMIITNVSGNTWVQSHSGAMLTPSNWLILGGGNVTITAGVVDRLALVTTSTDTFAGSGSVNIFYE